MQHSGKVPEIPDLGYAKYIANYMQRIGYPSPSVGYITHSEIASWSKATATHLSPDEHQLIFDMFVEYGSAKAHFEQNELEPAPYASDESKRRADVGSKLKQVLRMRKGKG